MIQRTRGKAGFLSLLLAALALSVLSALGLSAAADQEAATADPEYWAERDKWQRPEEVMNDLRLRAGSQVADVGCGEGYFTFHLAGRVGPQGRVYAEDIQPDLIRGLWHRALSRWLVQVRPVLSEESDPRLPRQRLDAILLVLSYHEMHGHDAMVKAFYHALRPGGLVGVIEFEAPDNQPRQEAYTRHRIPARTVKEEFTRQGFQFVATEPGFSPSGTKRKQFFLLFAKPGE